MMNDDKKIVADTELLLLLTIGLFDAENLSKIKYKNKKCQEADFDLLAQYLNNRRIITTPQILAEMCNIVENSLGHQLFKRYSQTILSFLREGIIEVYTSKDELIKLPALATFGFSDMSLFTILNDKHVLTSGDFPLFNYCTTNRKNVIYVDQIISPKWFTTK